VVIGSPPWHLSKETGARFRYSYWKLAVVAVLSALLLRVLILSLSAAVFQHWNWQSLRWQVESLVIVLGPVAAGMLGLTRRRLRPVSMTDAGIGLSVGGAPQPVVIRWSAVDRAEVRSRWLLAKLDVWLVDPAAVPASAREQPSGRDGDAPSYSVPVGLLSPGPNRMRAELARLRPGSNT
jgi:hypothetical protein